MQVLSLTFFTQFPTVSQVIQVEPSVHDIHPNIHMEQTPLLLKYPPWQTQAVLLDSTV
jgi:hypothetical protein